MKKIPCVLAILLIIALTKTSAQKKNGFTIDATLEGIEQGTMITLTTLEGETIDTCRLNQGKFHLEGSVSEGPRMVFVGIPFIPPFEKTVRLLVENGQHIELTCGNVRKINHGFIDEHIDIKGCATQAALKWLTPLGIFFNQAIGGLDNMLNQITDSVGFDPEAVGAFVKAKNELNYTLYVHFFEIPEDSTFRPVPYNAAIPFFLNKWCNTISSSHHSPYLLSAYNHLTEHEKNTYYGKMLYQRIVLSQGQSFPLFVLPTVEGKTLSLQGISSKSKLTLVSFWREASHERTQSEEELKTFYRLYHDKGLNIVSVPLDTSVTRTRQVLDESKHPWFNCIQGVNHKDFIDKNFPDIRQNSRITNVLIDSQGKIVAWQVEGAELHWYLWKYLDGHLNEFPSIY